MTTTTTQQQLPATQRLYRVARKGEPKTALELIRDASVPSELQDGDVLVKVDAAALNPVCVARSPVTYRVSNQ
jgi:hypothetical protein